MGTSCRTLDDGLRGRPCMGDDAEEGLDEALGEVTSSLARTLGPSMSSEVSPGGPLRAYLADHLIGSDVGLRTARRLHRQAEGDLQDFTQDLITRIPEEQRVLREVMKAAGRAVEPVSVVAAAFGAATSLGVWVRRALPEPVPSTLEDVEALIVGVRGKRLLWETMSRIAAADPRFDRWPFTRLAAEAEAQERRLVQFHHDAVESLLRD